LSKIVFTGREEATQGLGRQALDNVSNLKLYSVLGASGLDELDEGVY
jgi:hypothetical protein